MLSKLLETKNDYAALILRLTLGLVMFPHGAQKVLGWFGGFGFAATKHAFVDMMGMPLILFLLVVTAEFFGSLGLITGLLGRLSAFGIGAVMVGAILMVHQSNGFFMNWSGKQAGEGFEYHLLVIGLAVAVMVKGSGAWSLDQILTSRFSYQAAKPASALS